MIDVSNNTSSNPSAGGSGAPQPSSSSSTSSPPPSSHQVSPAQVYINHLVAEISQSISYKNTGKKSGTASELQGIFPWGSMTHIPPNPIVENGRKSPKASALYLQENDFYRKTVHFWVPEFIFQSHFTHSVYGTKFPCPTCKQAKREGGGFKDIECKGWGKKAVKVYGEHDVEYLVSKR